MFAFSLVLEQTVQVGRAVMESKITKQGVRGCLSTAGLHMDCGNITLYYQYYSKQEGQEMWLLWGENVLIKEI